MNIACTRDDLKSIEQNHEVNIRIAGNSYYVGNDIYTPALIKVVDEKMPIEPVYPQPQIKKPPIADLSEVERVTITSGNPIGYVEKPTKKK